MKRNLLFLITAVLCCIGLSNCSETEVGGKDHPDQTVYELNFVVDSSVCLPDSVNKIDEVLVLIYGENDRVVYSKHLKGTSLIVRLPEEEVAVKTLAVANVYAQEEWGVLYSEDGFLQRISLKDSMEVGRAFPGDWEGCSRLGYGALAVAGNVNIQERIGVPLPMAGKVEGKMSLQQTILLRPLVGQVAVENRSAVYPELKKVSFSGVPDFVPFFSGDTMVSSSAVTLDYTLPEDGAGAAGIFYLPAGGKAVAALTLGDERQDTRQEQVEVGVIERGACRKIVTESERLEADSVQVRLGASGGSVLIHLDANIAWKAEVGNGRFEVSPKSGSGNTVLELVATANAGREAKEDVLTIVPANGKKPVLHIPVHQAGEEVPEHFLELGSPSLEASKEGYGWVKPFELPVNADVVWTIECEETWVEYDYDEEAVSQVVKISVKENWDGEPRTAVLRFVAGTLVKEFVITQAAVSDRALSVDKEEIVFTGKGGTAELTVTANFEWTLAFSGGSFKADVESGTGNATIHITAPENTDTKPVHGSLFIRLVNGYEPSLEIKLRQEGSVPDFTLSPDGGSTLSFEAVAGTKDFVVTRRNEEVVYSVGTDKEWITVSKTAGSGLADTWQAAVTENTEGTVRTGKITVKSGLLEKEYTVRQAAKPGVPVFTTELKYKGAVLTEVLRVPAKASQGSLEMSATGSYNGENLYLRSAGGGACWAKIGNAVSTIWQDRIWAGRTDCLLLFEENTGEERTLEVEFYSRDPELVCKRLTIIQEKATDYLTLSTASLEVDRYGNEYDFPLELGVESNAVWSIECDADWVVAEYRQGTRIQTVNVLVKENTGGVARNTTLRFMVGGKVMKEFPISQSTAENSSFELKYELNLELSTTGDRFRDYRNGNAFYPDRIEIFNALSLGDATAKITSSAPYGFLTDAPGSFNHLEIKNFRDKFFVYRGYKGVAASQSYHNGGISIVDSRYSSVFFRQIFFTLPIPAGVKRTQMVRYKIVVNNITANRQHDTPVITYEVIEQ